MVHWIQMLHRQVQKECFLFTRWTEYKFTSVHTGTWKNKKAEDKNLNIFSPQNTTHIKNNFKKSLKKNSICWKILLPAVVPDHINCFVCSISLAPAHAGLQNHLTRYLAVGWVPSCYFKGTGLLGQIEGLLCQGIVCISVPTAKWRHTLVHSCSLLLNSCRFNPLAAKHSCQALMNAVSHQAEKHKIGNPLAVSVMAGLHQNPQYWRRAC